MTAKVNGSSLLGNQAVMADEVNPSSAPRSGNDLRLIFRAFSSRNYALFFSGQGISLIGTWMQRIALSWLVYRLTHSAFMLGVVGFAGQIPTFLAASFAGVLVDRWNKYRLIVVTQVLAMCQALILAALVLTNRITTWEILLLSVILGLINAIEIPARQSFVVEMIERREDLGNAIALNSSLVNIARLLGPSIAGVLIASIGEGLCFLVNGLSYLFVIAALLAMRIKPHVRPRETRHMLIELQEGFRYAFGFPPIRAILLLLALISLMGMPYQVLMPIFVTEVFHGGPRTLGFLMAASGGGALCGAIFLASRRSVRGLGRIIALASAVFGVGLIAFSLTSLPLVAMALLMIAGFGMMVNMAGCNTMLQTIVDDDKRGRVMAFFTMAFMGMAPFGSILGGSLAGLIGVGWTVACGGMSCILGAAIFAAQLPKYRALVRPVYELKGI